MKDLDLFSYAAEAQRLDEWFQRIADQYEGSGKEHPEWLAFKLLIEVNNKSTEAEKISLSNHANIKELASKLESRLKELREKREKEQQEKYTPKKQFVGHQEKPIRVYRSPTRKRPWHEISRDCSSND